MFIGIDIGGTNIKLGAVRKLEFKKIDREIIFPSVNNYKKDLENITQAISELSNGDPLAIGIGFPGSFKKNKIYRSPNLSDWNGKNPEKDLIEVFNCPVEINNDVSVLALGQAVYGGIQKDFLVFSWGSGFGGSRVSFVDNKILIFPIEPGHQIIEPKGYKCPCGQTGCLEQYIGGKAILKTNHKEIKLINKSEQKKIFNFLSYGILNILISHPVSQIYFAGTVALKQSDWIKNISDLVYKRISIIPPPKFSLVKFKNKAGVYGALALLNKRKKFLIKN